MARPGEEREPPQVLPREVEGFLGEVVDNLPLPFEVLRFFHQNPYAIVTIPDLTIWTSREERPLAEALQHLARLGYLEPSYASAAYTLTADGEKRRQLEGFFGFLDENPDAARRIRRQLQPQRETE